MCVRSLAACLLVATISATASIGAGAEVPSWAKVSAEQVASAKKLDVPVAMENSTGMRFVLIPPGTFMMGSRDSAAEVARRCNMPNAQAGWFSDEQPSRKVTLTGAFYISTTEVTQGCYEAVTNPDPDKNKDKKPADEYPAEYKGTNHPALMVSWEDAEKFCKALSTTDDRVYSLPTEAQWEYACRAGTTTPFAFGETISTDQANYHGGYTYGDGQKGPNREKPLPAGSLAANAWGLVDMHGNVSEWCADRYGQYGSEAESDPRGPEEGNQRVVRGGSWRSYPGACRSALRLSGDMRSRSYTAGFRVCCVVAVESASGEEPQKP
ncbi:MAG: formylglycine-generating enzyme family protein [Candidatus Nealsonbacteria bacterium]|nr:formylglycine-generating enzyme family protein [Candidatus Nealsonbacteria bacterium]